MNLEIEAYEGELRELRKALAQPEQEPVAYVTIEPAIDGDWRKCPSIKWFNKPTDGPLYTAPPALAQPEQEPVAWVYNGIRKCPSIKWFNKPTDGPLYTAPPKREWVCLTDEEIEECKINGGLPHAINWRLSVKVMEAKLKEKNT
jgi:hypothetical protein